METKFKVGEIVEYTCIVGTVHAEILKIQPSGKLLLDMKSKQLKLIGKTDYERKRKTVKLSCNVSVMPHRIKKIILEGEELLAFATHKTKIEN